MRVCSLFMRSRQSERAIGVLVVPAALLWLWGRLFEFDDDLLEVALVLVPLFAGVLPGTVSTSPFGELERTASRTLRGLRLTQSGLLLVLAVAGFLIATWSWQLDGALERSLRNLFGFAGLGLLTATALGGRLAWTGPLAYGIGCFALVTNDRLYDWALPFQPAGDELASAVAGVTLLAGLVLIARSGAPDIPVD